MARKARTKSVADMLRGMLGSGWSKKQIEYRTGMSVRAQTDALAGRRPGEKYAGAVRSARRSSAGRGPAAGKPIQPVKGSGAGTRTSTLMGGGKLRNVTVTSSTDPSILRGELQKAGQQNIVFTVGATDLIRYGRPMVAHGEFQLFKKGGGWSAAKFLARVDNPGPGDDWKAGDIFGAIKGLAISLGVAESMGRVTSVSFNYVPRGRAR